MWHPDLTEDEAIAMMQVCAVAWSSCMLSKFMGSRHRHTCSRGHKFSLVYGAFVEAPMLTCLLLQSLTTPAKACPCLFVCARHGNVPDMDAHMLTYCCVLVGEVVEH